MTIQMKKMVPTFVPSCQKFMLKLWIFMMIKMKPLPLQMMSLEQLHTTLKLSLEVNQLCMSTSMHAKQSKLFDIKLWGFEFGILRISTIEYFISTQIMCSKLFQKISSILMSSHVKGLKLIQDLHLFIVTLLPVSSLRMHKKYSLFGTILAHLHFNQFNDWMIQF